MKLNNSKELHRAAMRHAQEAYMAVLNGDNAAALPLYEQAFRLEQQAANHFILDLEQQPTRSVLFRSAANLAFKCQRYEDAKTMIHFGLAGNPPKEIVDELLQLSKQIDKTVKKAQFGSEKVKKPKPQPFWLKGMLRSADAETRTMTLVSEDRKPSVVLVPQGLSAIVRDYWEQNMSVCIVKHGKQFTLVEIDKIFMPKTA